ncbi:hypothetical protein ACMYSP_03550 [Klebsiella sp. R390]|uniref:hypothetical protein n=1 Tax=Klebsiella sp. R390 TaxID=2755400 RepID=UPI003DA9ABD8
MMISRAQEMQVQAQRLQEQGLLRRALALWADMARCDDHEVARLARQKQQEIVTLLQQKKDQQAASRYNCRAHVAADRELIIAYLRNGMKPREIEALTQRSSAFIYHCKKLLPED